MAKKYTLVQPITAVLNLDNAQFTISHFGGRNTNSTAANPTVTLFNADPDGMCTRDMASY